MCFALAMGDEPGDLLAVLARRLRLALQESREVVERSHVLTAASRLARSTTVMAKRCAWCGRVDLGLGWRSPDRAPAFLTATLERRATHTICPDCVRRLEETGKSLRPPGSANDEQPADPEREDDERQP